MLISSDSIFDNFYCFLSCMIAAWKKGREVIFVDYSCSPCEQSEFSCCSQGWMTQVSNFFWCHLPGMMCLWCWQSLQKHCGNRQGLILRSEFCCGIPDIFSILGEGVSLEVWCIYLAWNLLQVEFCLASALQDLTGFAHLVFWHFRIF